MAVRFILGRSGTGKTSYCIKTIVDSLLTPDRQQLILLVPEQATYQAERAILSDKRLAGYNRLNVLSFDRLGFLLSGKNTARPRLSRIGRQMIVHRILREQKSKLKILDASATSAGLSRQMTEVITELHRYAKTPEDIDQLLSQLQKDRHNSLTGMKFADIRLVLKEYLGFIEGKFIDPDIQLADTQQAVAQADFIKGAKLWVDGFAGFTTTELAILAELLKSTEDAQIALCLDPSKLNIKNIDPVGLFNPTERTYTDLVEIIKKCGLKLAKPITLKKPARFSSCPQLGHIEQNIFEPPQAKIKAADNIRIVSAPNVRTETQFVAKQILRLVKEKKYRYRDIAVIAPDISQYQHYIKAYFEDYNLPFFIDRPRPLNQHPVIQLICSALAVVSGGFSHRDIFAWLKTGLVPIDKHDVDTLENYCLAFGISGGDWTGGKDWQFQDKTNPSFDEQYVNQIRIKAAAPLLELRSNLCSGDNSQISAGEFTRVVFDFLDCLGVRETIGKQIEEATQANDYVTADEHRQFYDKFVDIFDKLVEVFGEQQMDWQDLAGIIDSAFSQMKLTFIPPKLDQVLVGSIERSRHPDLKAVFLIGASQKQFPTPISFDSLLTDDDRRAAESADFELAAAMSQTLCERQYLAYIAFTRPSQFLCITYPAADDKSNAAVRSQFIDNLASLFEDLNEESVQSEQIINNEAELAEMLCGDGQFDKLLSEVCADEQLSELGQAVQSAINYDNSAQLDKAIVDKLFGQKIKSSATRLGTFAACPYQHFARYILKLKQRDEFKFEPLDLGRFYHSILDALLKKLNEKKKDFATIQTDELLAILRKQTALLTQTDSFISHFARHSSHNMFIITSAGEILEDSVLAIAKMVRAGKFRPKLSELSFDKYKIGLSNNRQLILRGKIDRLDTADIDGEINAIVFDYKRKSKSFSWSQFYHGLDMQLAIYMLALRNTSEPNLKIQKVAGAFYMPVEPQIKSGTIDELAEKKDSFGYKAKGIFDGRIARQLDEQLTSGNSEFYNFYVKKDGQPYGSYNSRGALKPDDFKKMLTFAQTKIIALAEKIISGEICITPYKSGTKRACDYCDYKSLCRFDWQINKYNHLDSIGKEKVLQQMEQSNG